MTLVVTDQGGSVNVDENGRSADHPKGSLIIRETPTHFQLKDKDNKLLYESLIVETTPNTIDGFRALGLGGGGSQSGRDGVRTPLLINDTTAVVATVNDPIRKGGIIWNESGRQARVLYGLGDASLTDFSEIIPNNGELIIPPFAVTSRISIIKDFGGLATGNVQITLF